MQSNIYKTTIERGVHIFKVNVSLNIESMGNSYTHEVQISYKDDSGKDVKSSHELVTNLIDVDLAKFIVERVESIVDNIYSKLIGLDAFDSYMDKNDYFKVVN